MLIYSIKNLISIIKEYKEVFGIFFVVSSLTVFSFLYLNVYNFNMLKEGEQSTTSTRTYTVNGIFENGTDEKSVSLISESITDNEIQMALFLPVSDDVNQEDTISFGTLFYGTAEKWISIDRGSGDIRQNSNEIIVDDLFYIKNNLNWNINDSIMVHSCDLKLIGIGHIANYNLEALVSYDAYKKMELPTGKIIITFENRLSNEQYDIFLSCFENEIEADKPAMFNSTILSQYGNRIMLIILLIIIATFNVMGLYRYIIMRRKKEFLIYKIYGITGNRLIRLIIYETVILTFMSFLLGSVLFIIIQFTELKDLSGLYISIIFIQTFILQIFFSILSTIPIFRELNKKSIVVEYLQEEVR